MHDAWLAAADRLGAFRWESSFRSWLSGFVINQVRQRWRADRREPVPLEETRAGDDLPLLMAADRVDLERAIAALPDGFRAVLVLHDIEGYTHDEIGSVLGIVAGTSKSQLARARSAVREALEQGTVHDAR